MKKITKLTGILCAAVMTAAMSFAGFADMEPVQKPIPPVLMEGTVVSVEDGRMTMNRRIGDSQEEIIIHLADNTKILNAVDGLPVPAENLDAGEAVRVYTSPAMTMSIPAQTTGYVVLADIPADAAFPSYGEIEGLTKNSNGTYTLTTTDEKNYTVTSSTVLLPYLTRNIVVVDDLTAGKNVLVWENNGTAAKIVLYPAAAEAEMKDGWYEEDGTWFYRLNGMNHTGWLLDNGDWYYLDPLTAMMRTGFITVDGKTYFMEESGRMITKARVFTPDENGVLHE